MVRGGGKRYKISVRAGGKRYRVNGKGWRK